MFNVFINFLYVCGMILAATITFFVVGAFADMIYETIKGKKEDK